ncbi:hypothetical protein ACTU3I_09650 [Microbacterium sp. RD1]|uniref:hypothetical protein n=1 Tax=Microbacterium sp. RD1 TaxID=3457313 RepID=UPI003FA5C24F
MFARAVRSLATAACAAVLLAGCTGTPAPTPSPSASLTDEEAFAAAEETYRAYVDALNQVDLSDPATFEPVYALTTGEANANERESLTQMHADGWSVGGETVLERVIGDSVESNSGGLSITALVCTDVSSVRVVDAAGQSVVSPDRPPKFTLRVVFAEIGTGFAISSSNAVEEPGCD